MTTRTSDDRRPAILHGFADHGVESEALRLYGDVTRATLNPVEYPHSEAIRADLSDPDSVPFRDGSFALGVFHPPCTAWSDMPGANKAGDAPKLIDEARELGERYCEQYIIENKPTAPLRSPTVLDGRMFGLPIKYERAFETSFDVPQPPRQARLTEPAETSTFYYPERSPEWWRVAKGGIPDRYPKQHLAKNCLPLPFVHYLIRAWMDATGRSQGESDYSDYDAQMSEKRARETNESLEAF